MDERTNFERLEESLIPETETQEPRPGGGSGDADDHMDEGLNQGPNLGAPLPGIGTGVHGENVSTPIQTPEIWGPTPSNESVLATFPEENPPGEVGMPVSPLEKLPGLVTHAEIIEDARRRSQQ